MKSDLVFQLEFRDGASARVVMGEASYEEHVRLSNALAAAIPNSVDRNACLFGVGVTFGQLLESSHTGVKSDMMEKSGYRIDIRFQPREAE